MTGEVICGVVFIFMVLFIILRLLDGHNYLILTIELIMLYCSIVFSGYSGVFEIPMLTVTIIMAIMFFGDIFSEVSADRDYRGIHVEGYVDDWEEERIGRELRKSEKTFLIVMGFFIPIALIPTFLIVISAFIGFIFSIIAYIVVVLLMTTFIVKRVDEIRVGEYRMCLLCRIGMHDWSLSNCSDVDVCRRCGLKRKHFRMIDKEERHIPAGANCAGMNRW